MQASTSLPAPYKTKLAFVVLLLKLCCRCHLIYCCKRRSAPCTVAIVVVEVTVVAVVAAVVAAVAIAAAVQLLL